MKYIVKNYSDRILLARLCICNLQGVLFLQKHLRELLVITLEETNTKSCNIILPKIVENIKIL